jgi:hypothetical protein
MAMHGERIQKFLFLYDYWYPKELSSSITLYTSSKTNFPPISRQTFKFAKPLFLHFHANGQGYSCEIT